MAIEPNNIKQVEHNGQSMTIVEMGTIPEYDKEDYNLTVDKERNKYFKDIEKSVRNSFEYREYISYLREYMDMNKCSFFENVNNLETFNIKIHLHHSPITLYELVLTVYEKRVYYHECTDVESVAKEVMYVHYCLMIGLIPLCETVHELVHNGYIFVPNSSVLGNYASFIALYDNWIHPDVRVKLDRIEEFSSVYNEADNMNILRTNYIYLDFSGAYKLPKMEDVVKAVSDRMDTIRDNNFNMNIPMITILADDKDILG